MSSSSWRKSPCRGSGSPGFWGGSPAYAPPVPRGEVGPLRQPSPKVIAGRPQCATRGDFEVCVAEKSRLRRLRGLAKRGQEFIRVGKSLPLPRRRSTMGLKTRNRGPGRRLFGKGRLVTPLHTLAKACSMKRRKLLLVAVFVLLGAGV